MSEFSPTWEEWLLSTIFPNPGNWITDSSGESQFYLFANLSATAYAGLASMGYHYYFGGITPDMILKHGSKWRAAGYLATDSPGLANTLRILRRAPPWMAAGVGRDVLDKHASDNIHGNPFIADARARGFFTSTSNLILSSLR